MGDFYSDPRFGVRQNILMGIGYGAIGSANAARTTLDRHTFMTAVTVKDFNLKVLTGATCTGLASNLNTELYVLCLGKSPAGTGLEDIGGSAWVAGTAASDAPAASAVKAADKSVVDATITETDFDAGDDLVFFAEIGTALGDNSLIAHASVDYVERYT